MQYGQPSSLSLSFPFSLVLSNAHSLPPSFPSCLYLLLFLLFPLLLYSLSLFIFFTPSTSFPIFSSPCPYLVPCLRHSPSSPSLFPFTFSFSPCPFPPTSSPRPYLSLLPFSFPYLYLGKKIPAPLQCEIPSHPRPPRSLFPAGIPSTRKGIWSRLWSPFKCGTKGLIKSDL